MLSAVWLLAQLSFSQINVMTFNVRLNVESDGENAWPYRMATVKSMFETYKPDVIGMQEVLPGQLSDLKTMLKTYKQLGVGREDGKDKGEYCPLFFNESRFQLVKQGNFSLSETPWKFGVKGWDAACERIASWAVLIDNSTLDTILFINTHLDHVGEIARLESSKLILKNIDELGANFPVVLMGDFNAVPGSAVVTNFLNHKLVNSALVAKMKSGPISTFHDFGRIPVSERRTIDYILMSSHFGVNSYEVIIDPETSFISDHHPVQVNIRIK